MASVHANSAREAITKMCTLQLLAGENVGSRFVVPTVARCIDLKEVMTRAGHRTVGAAMGYQHNADHRGPEVAAAMAALAVGARTIG